MRTPDGALAPLSVNSASNAVSKASLRVGDIAGETQECSPMALRVKRFVGFGSHPFAKGTRRLGPQGNLISRRCIEQI